MNRLATFATAFGKTLVGQEMLARPMSAQPRHSKTLAPISGRIRLYERKRSPGKQHLLYNRNYGRD
jgi:hypothetical protein